MHAIVESQIASVVGDTLDFLAKQLVRIRDHDRLLHIAEVAEKTRRIREAEESGRKNRTTTFLTLIAKRQSEQTVLDQGSRLFEEIFQVNSETAESFLSNIIAESVETSSLPNCLTILITAAATRQALTLAQAYTPEPHPSEANPETSVMAVLALLESFVVPAVEKESRRQEGV